MLCLYQQWILEGDLGLILRSLKRQGWGQEMGQRHKPDLDGFSHNQNTSDILLGWPEPGGSSPFQSC